MTSETKKSRIETDVLVLGAGLGGSMLAAILARHGVRVVLVDDGAHPRFAIGESTVPETTFLFEVISQRYDVPEIGHLRNFHRIRRHVSSACGIKRNFSFAYHREGQTHRPEETTQFPTWGPPFGPDVHLFRQDIDAYLFAAAVRHGAIARTRTRITRVHVHEDEVRAEAATGECFSAKCIVDASGYRSPVAESLGLRQDPCRMVTQSRSIFTHMIGVPPYDQIGPGHKQHEMPSPLAHGTLHHLFDGGWFWIIPFDNHATSTNPLCSVGLSLDLQKHPSTGMDAEAEFSSFVRRFPSIDRHLSGARAVRPWVSTGRIQYSCTRAAGNRFVLLPHAAGFVDALFSGGLTLTAAMVNALGHRLIAATKEDDFSAERFAYIDEWVCRGLAHNDRLVANGYTALRDFDLWNAWHRVWMLGSTYGATGHVEILSRYAVDGDRAHFDRFERPPQRGTQSSDVAPFRTLFDGAAREVEAVRAGAISKSAATKRIYEHLQASGLCPPHWGLTDPARRCPTTFTLVPLARLAAWGYWRAPPLLQNNFDLRGRVGAVFADLAADADIEFRRSAQLVSSFLKDAFWP